MSKQYQLPNINFNDYFKPKAMIWVSKAYLLVAALLHVVVLALYIYSGVKILAINSIVDMVLFFTFFLMFNENRIRTIYTTVILIIETYVIIHVFTLGWNYNFFIYSFMMIPLSILSSISVKEKRYNIKLPIIYFIITQGILLGIRIYNMYNPIEPLFEFEGLIHNLYVIEGIIVYVTTTIASFVPLYAFILDVNNAYARMEKMNLDLKYTATHDNLTGLINRHSINDYFERALINYNINKKDFSIILADIDNFKKINDTYGHNNGDIVLKSIAKIMKSTVDNGDFVCRWGGEEILVLVHNNKDYAITVAEKIRKAISDSPIVANEHNLNVTLTLGVANYNNHNSINELITVADERLYKGKQSTKNCVIA
ncbi:MAG: GGDEF domain-containing protein [Lachnospiraceae bacterium]|nr:GGDEF domain-containing protein [Lachnospiraceae bacterium]